MADSNENSLFFGENIPQPLKEPFNGNDKNIKAKIKAGAKDLALNVKDSTVDFFKDVQKSVKDRLTLSSKRNAITDNIEYGTEEVSMSNRHKDAISGILNNTFNGNLFDAGVSTLNLLNFGTKWKVAYKSDIDRNVYPFKYLYYYNPLYGQKVSTDKTGTEADVTPALTFLDDIEDPTILGFTLKIDFDNSPLFKNVVNSVGKIPKKASDKAPSEGDVNKNTTSNDSSIRASDMENSAFGFIYDYSNFHPELNYAYQYLQDFTLSCNKIFSAPEINKSEYNIIKYKNSYIYEIKGLNKLDNRYVEYKESGDEYEALEFTLGEDIRMYVTRMAILYQNLTWSRNMGKKLIPENLLRFNLYIKISEMRNFTSKVKDSNGDNEDDNSLTDAIRNGYSRIIYELKDCEFIFDESILPETLTMGGNETNDKYANLKLKIKYRKVNRIFYSKLFSSNFAQNIIGDKFYTPNTSKYIDDLSDIGFIPKNTSKNKSYSNNIPVYQSLASKLDRLKNNGLLTEDNNDTAVGRFAKSVGNKAIKAGASILDDKMQEVKSGINDFGKNVFNNNFSSSIRDLLKDKVQTKSKILGKSLHLNTGKQFSDVNEVIDFASTHLPIINNVNEDLHPNLIDVILPPKEDLHPTINPKIKAPKEDLHPTINPKIIAPNEDLHPTLNDSIISPNEDLHPTLNVKIVAPIEDLHPNLIDKIIAPNEDLHPNINLNIKEPNEDLHPILNNSIISPKEDLHPIINPKIIAPNEDLHPILNDSIISPNEKLHPISNNKIVDPNENLVSKIPFKVESPNENLHSVSNNKIVDPNETVSSKTDYNIIHPNENLHNISSKSDVILNEKLHKKVSGDIVPPNENVNDNFKKFIKKDIPTPPANPALGEC